MTEAPAPSDQRGRALWSFLAQGLASANGLASTVVAARALTPVEFGYFAALVTVAIAFVELIGSLLSQPLLLTRGGPERIAAQARSTLFAAPIFGALAGVILIGSSVFFGQVQHGLWILAVSCPLAAVCQVYRYFGAVLGRAYLAALLDGMRLLLFLVGYVVLMSGSRQDSTSMIALWCGCAIVVGVLALGLGARMTRSAPVDLRQFATPRFLGYQFGAEYLMGIFGRTMPMLSLGWFVAVAAIGSFRGMWTLFGPILVLAVATVMVAAPYLVRHPGAKRNRALILMGAGFTLASLTWMTILLLIPDNIGHQILGEAWAGSRPLIVPVALQVVGTGILTTAQTGVRVVRPRYSFVLNVSAISWSLGCFFIGVLTGGLSGAAWGFAVGAFGAAAIAIGIYLKVKDSPAEVA